MLFTTTAFAESSSLNLSLPGAPGSYQSDKFRAGELDCTNAIGSATNLEFGVTGIIDKGRYDTMNNYLMTHRQVILEFMQELRYHLVTEQRIELIVIDYTNLK